MISTVAVVLYSHNLALGVLTGVLLSSLYFAKKIAMYQKVSLLKENNSFNYIIKGQVFFASANKFIRSFIFDKNIKKVNIDVSDAHFWDLSAVTALDRIVEKYKKTGVVVNVTGLNLASKTIVNKLSEVENKEINIL